MLRKYQATPSMNAEIAGEVAKWTGQPVVAPAPDYTNGEEWARRLRRLIEAEDGRCEIRMMRIGGAQVFVYVCGSPGSRPYAQGVGATPVLAICDAFLNCAVARRVHRDDVSAGAFSRPVSHPR
jgi:hypothetical protein